MRLTHRTAPIGSCGASSAKAILSAGLREEQSVTAAAIPTASEAATLVAELRRTLDGEVLDDRYTRHLYSADASMYSITPAAVVFPRHANDVATTVSLAAGAGVPIVARGAGTSLAGQTIGAGLVLDCSRHMRQILELDPQSLRARVQPGVVQDQLNRAAGKHGLMFGADTSTSNRATLGGMIGNNSSGTYSILYGTTVDHVCSLDVVLADATMARLEPVDEQERLRRAQADTLEGALYARLPELIESHRDVIARDQPTAWRQSGGYHLDRVLAGLPGLDLARFVVGSEGGLAIVTEAEVSLIERPRAQAMAVGHFNSTPEAIAATHDALSLNAVAAELMDRTILDLSRTKHEFAGLSQMLEGDPDALLFVTFFGDTPAEAADQVQKLSKLWERHGHGYHTLHATTAADQAKVLTVRKASLGLLMAASRGTSRPLAFIEDTAVDPSVLEEYVARFAQVLERRGLHAGFYGHCSVGCLHIRPFVDLRREADVEKMRAVAEEVLELVLEYGGINSSEHGDGLARSEFNRRFFGEELYGVMREVKRLFDPAGILNPGKIVDADPMTSHLRDPAMPEPAPLATRISFGEGGSMFAAADRCMNIGACRKTDAGTMCPSYMATLDEQHSTRGRANALALALTQPDPHQALADERLHQALDLCLECKACKSECPLSVDMASLKSEALAHRNDVHGTPLRARAFGSIRRINQLGAALAPLSNLLAGNSASRALTHRVLGISRHRPLPAFERETLLRWNKRRPTQHQGARGEVVFLADSFTSFTDTSVPKAAIELLEAAGWRVTIEGRGCCGRASISKGMLDQARTMASTTVSRLAPYARRGVPIVGCEPSCLLTLTDEYLGLLADEPNARVVADQVTSVADLLLAAIADGSLRLRSQSPLAGRRILVHPHCHEKAVTGTRATVELLRQIPGAEIVELDVGCCGMAGSFGFEAEHYELSTKIAGMRLLPALNDAPDAVVAATGVSCRQQIRHLAGREVRHPLELLLQALE
jgi:FAD/FMN-containing dehydrogenase/Fe-S oxidoreductase